MKKCISILLAAALALCCLPACGSQDAASAGTAQTSAQTEKLQIVATIFPEYDWVKEILGSEAENAELTLLLDNGVDLHSYQPTAEDILKISTCDLFIYVGGHSDTWVEDALKEATNENMVTINLCEVLGDAVKLEEQVEGMENSHENEHADDAEESSEDHHHNDEHVWLSLKNARVLCTEIAAALSGLDPDHADAYAANAAAYDDQLAALDAQYQEAVDNASGSTLLFGDRFPFRYLVDDYGLTYYAAFTGCSAESEASFETITFLAGKVDELNLHTVLTIENSNQKIAETIIQNTETKNQQILTMDSMQSTTSDDVANGETYLSVMEGNLSVLKEALG